MLLLRYAMTLASLRNYRKQWASQARGRYCVSVPFPRVPPHQTKLVFEILAWHLVPGVLKAEVLWLWSLLAYLCQFQTMQVPSSSILEDALLLRYAMALSPRQTHAKDWTNPARGRYSVKVPVPRASPHQTNLTFEVRAWHLVPRVLKAGVLWLCSLLAYLCQFWTMQVPSLSRLEDALLLRYSMALSPRQTYA